MIQNEKSFRGTPYGLFLNLDGVRLEQINDEFFVGFKAFKHQIISENLIKEQKPLFLFNHSPTGSGKTISWLKPVLDTKMKVIAVYPTNALVIDQKMQVENAIKKFGYDPDEYHVQEITSDLLDQEKKLYPDEKGLKKGQLLNRIIRKGRGKGLILLTNPDILTLALKDAYYEHNIRESVRSVDIIVVDEFHLASVKQSDMLLFMMHEINDDKRSRLSKFVFLSATPNSAIVERAKKVGLNTIVLPDESAPLSYSTGRPILPKLRLEIRKGSIYKTYELIKGDLEYFVEFCTHRTNNGEKAKTVFIVDGIYEVDEIYNTLSVVLVGLRVERVDGLHPATQEKLENFDVLISNSSIEVGIDFNVDRLVFSGYSREKLLQRIGRLRNKSPEEICEAICFVPEAVYDHLKENNRNLTRGEFDLHLQKVMNSQMDLSSYSKRYSPLEAYLYSIERIFGKSWIDKNGREHHIKGMPESIQSEELIRTLTLIEKHFLGSEVDGPVFDNLKHESRKLKDGLLSYRGSSFQALIFDATDYSLKLYDLMYLLRRGNIEFMSSKKFIRKLKEILGEEYESLIQGKYESMKDYASGFCWYYGTIGDETRKVIFKGDSGEHYKKIMLNAVDHVRKPCITNGFKVETDPNIPTLSSLNDTLSKYEVFTRLVDQDSFSLKAKFKLEDFFYLYPYSGMRTVAFGHEALYIDCLIKEDYAQR
ncbi:type I-D CRISPR-associated helicase Cas3' [Methanosarcina sp.]|uniref:type I-D CRISPR-associated helicase Cas3' n=1 Tax=Methanosarcina sp. TaxID=2213 RepID=UPI003BB4FB2B